jgi:hypothetical protein
MKPAPTLADDIMREWSRRSYREIDPNNWVASHIAQARKFVLDESMSTFMADLSYTTLNACKTDAKRHHLIESMRRLARLPHAITWIEFDKQAHRRRVKEAYHPEIVAEPDSVPDRTGWLLMQHPKIETAFMALHCTSHSWDGANSRQFLPNAGQFAYAWTCDDSVPPWPRDSFYHQDQPCYLESGDPSTIATPAGILSGVLSYQTESFSILQAPYMSRKADAVFRKMAGRYFNPLGEMAHDARYLWSLLATLNDLPTTQAEIKSDKGYLSRGSYKRFCDHTVISLTVPAKRYALVAKRAIAIARRRGHQVRGHFRINRWHPGERIWVREHTRGDTSLGFVLHDYTVSHEKQLLTS